MFRSYNLKVIHKSIINLICLKKTNRSSFNNFNLISPNSVPVMPQLAEGSTPTFFTCGELVVLNVDFDKCELNGFVNLQIVLNETFFEKRSFSDQSKHCIGVNLRSLMDERKNIKINNVMVDGVPTKWHKRKPYTKRTQNIDIAKLRDLANFDVRCFVFF